MIYKQKVLAAKVETTNGTAIALAAADAAHNVYDAVIEAEAEMHDRPGQSALSPLSAVVGARAGRCRFSLDLTGSGDSEDPPPLWADTFLSACGFYDDSDTFKLKTAMPGVGAADLHTLTIGLYEAGRRRMIHGAMGNVTFHFRAGFPTRAEFDFLGVWDAPTDVAILAPTYPDEIPPRWAGSAFTVASWSPKASEMTIDLGNELKLLEDPLNATGYTYAAIVGRKVAGSLDPLAALVATNDTYGQWLASTEQALSAVLGATAGNIVTFAAPKLQFTSIADGERGGVRTDPLEFQLNRSAVAGDDELTIAFT